MAIRSTPQLILMGAGSGPFESGFFSFRQQRRPRWCWAACTSMLLDILSKQPKDQCEIAGERLGLACCGLAPTTGCVSSASVPEFDCDQTQFPAGIDLVLGDQDIDFTPRPSLLPQLELDNQVVTQRRPVQLYYENNGIAHVVLVVSKEGSVYVVADPCETGIQKADYSELLNYRGPWTRTWVDLR